MALPTRAPRRAAFNAAEVTLLVLIVAIVVRFCTIPSASSIVEVTRAANHLPCGTDGALDLRGSVKVALLDRSCAYHPVELASKVPLLLIITIAFIVSGLVFCVATTRGRKRDGLFRPWVRLGLLGMIALGIYPATTIRSAASDTAAQQSALIGHLEEACKASREKMKQVDSQALDQCHAQGFRALKDCLGLQTNKETYETARDEVIKDALEEAKLGVAPRCDLPPPSTGETMRRTLTLNASAPTAETPSTTDDTTRPHGGSGPQAPSDGGVDAPTDDAGKGDVASGGDGDSGGVVMPGGCTTQNCQAPARCDGDVCKPPPPTNKPARRRSGLSIQAAILMGALGITAPIAWLIVNGSGESEDSEVPGSTLYDTAATAKRDPKSPAASRVIARGARRTGEFQEAIADVRTDEARELRSEVACLAEIQRTAKPGANGVIGGCTVTTIDGLSQLFSTSAACREIANDNTAAHELREWVAKCVCKNELSNLVPREIKCDLSP